MLEVSSTGPQSDVMTRINGLVEERRRILCGSRSQPIFGSKAQQRLRQVDSELEQLWLRRRVELNASEFATDRLGEGFSELDDASVVL